MSLDKFLSITATMLGFGGSVFLAKGVFGISPEYIVKYSRTIIGGNPLHIESLVTQKAEILCGLALIAIAFVFQFLNLVLVQRAIKIFESHWLGFALATALSGIVLVLFLFINSGLRTQYEHDVKKAKVKVRLEYSFTVDKKISEHTYSEISKGANEYWKIYRSDGESPKEFIQRLAQVLNLALPPDYDFSEIEK